VNEAGQKRLQQEITQRDFNRKEADEAAAAKAKWLGHNNRELEAYLFLP